MSRDAEKDVGPVIEGPYERHSVVDTWWWERPNGHGDLGYNRPDVLLRCARIFGGRIKVIRMVEASTTTVHCVTPPGADQ